MGRRKSIMFGADAVRCMRRGFSGSSGYTDWRIIINKSQVTDFPAQLTTVEFRDAVGGLSVSTGGLAYASSEHSLHLADDAFDGLSGTYWSTNLYPAMPPWIAYSHTAPVDIAEIFVVNLTTGRSPLEMQIEKSPDGNLWEHVATFTVDPPMISGEGRSFILF